MIDRDRILAKLDEVDGYLRELRSVVPASFPEYLAVEKRRSSERLLQVAIEAVIDLDAVLEGVQARPPASTFLDAGGAPERQLRDFPSEDLMVEGKGFEPSTSALRTPRSPN